MAIKSKSPAIGDVVISHLHSYVGMVFFVHPNLYAVQWNNASGLDDWFEKQRPILHPALKSKKWVEVILFSTQGSVLLPAGTVEVVLPFARTKLLLAELVKSAKKT